MSIADKIIHEWKQKVFKPFYWLEGEEPFFIDQVMNYAERYLLTEQEAAFNLTVFYGRDAQWATVINACRRYPVFAEKQVVLLKEAQQMSDILLLEPYFDKPLGSTIFVVGYKNKKLDGRSKLARLIHQKGALISSEKIKDYKLGEWIYEMVEQKGYSITPKAVSLLEQNVGNNLSRLVNEVEKLLLVLANRKKITEDDIEEYIGISKEYNVFELQDALAQKNLSKALKIINYFAQNPKAAPLQMVLSALYNHYSRLYALSGMGAVTEKQAAGLFYNNVFAAKQAIQTLKNYGKEGIEKILLLLHEYNLRSVGIHNINTYDADLLKELAVKIIY